ncbi:MAG TPA: serpin family protein [bacterium]
MKSHGPRLVATFGAILGAVLLTVSWCVPPSVAEVVLVPSGPPQEADQEPQPTPQLTDAINGFGFDLLRVVAAEDGARGNAIVSPVSVHAAFSMTANGATDETETQMREALHTASMDAADTNRQWADLLAGLAGRSSEQTLDVANALWARQGIAFRAPFLNAARDFFGAQVSTLDFERDDAAGAVNGWVSEKTHGRIDRILGQVPPNAILYLTNAAYFYGEWLTPFKDAATGRQAFTRADGSTVDVEMMNASRPMPYAQNGALQATVLPYAGDDAAFYVLLPKLGETVDSAIASLGETGFSRLVRSMRSAEVDLGLPKLDADFAVELSGPLESLGMSRAFDGEQAQFSGMASLGVPISINRVIHRTRVKVDEKGTEAAAATVAEIGVTASRDAPPRIRIICDRPYVFAVVDVKSGAMLFLGAVNDPRK